MIVPPAVDKEIRNLEQFNYNLQEYKTCKWIQIQIPSNKVEVKSLKKELDPGESEAISLAKELKADILTL